MGFDQGRIGGKTMTYEETVDALNEMISSLERDIEDKKFGTKRPLPPIYWLMADYHRLKGVLELLRKQNEILTVLESHAKIVTPLMGPNDPKYYQSVQITIYADDEKMPLIRKWLEEKE